MAGDDIYGWPIACFFKLILEARHDLQSLTIPPKFMKIHGKNLSNKIYLNIPCGKVWKLELLRKNSKAFLHEGWLEFVEFYSLKDGHSLMFKYRGKSCFEVIIMDMRAYEIEYPIQPENYRESPPQERKIDGHLTNISSSKTAKGVNTTTMGDELIIANSGRYVGLTPQQHKTVRKYANYHCKHPSFATKIHPTFLQHKSGNISIPNEFARRNLGTEPFTCIFNLQTNDNVGKTWSVRVVRKITRVRLFLGSKLMFAVDNKLQVGNLCIFELIKKQEFKVHILRVTNAKGRGKNRVIYQN